MTKQEEEEEPQPLQEQSLRKPDESRGHDYHEVKLHHVNSNDKEHLIKQEPAEIPVEHQQPLQEQSIGIPDASRGRFDEQSSHCDKSNDILYNVPHQYPGDRYPEGLDDAKMAKLDARHKAVPEEFYTNSGRRVLSPETFPSWVSATKTKKVNLWEICSGSGRLSWLAVVAGLMVACPLNCRHGWDLSKPSHISPTDDPRSSRQAGPGCAHDTSELSTMDGVCEPSEPGGELTTT